MDITYVMKVHQITITMLLITIGLLLRKYGEWRDDVNQYIAISTRCNFELLKINKKNCVQLCSIAKVITMWLQYNFLKVQKKISFILHMELRL